MKIYHNHLTQTLTKKIIPVWLVFGDEAWQKNDSIALIKAHAKEQGFSELLRFSSSNNFDWQQLMDEYQSLSLFSNKRIIEIELTSNKVGDIGSKALLALSERLMADTKNVHNLLDVIFIFHGAKLDTASVNKKWFKNLTQLGCYLPLYDIDLKAMPQWVNQQARMLQLNLATEVPLLLITLFEGNLLALSQELQKLSLLFGQSLISFKQAEQLLIKQAKFNPFQVIDALLLGDCKRCIMMLDQLQQEGTVPASITWVFHKEINQLYAMLNQLEQGVTLSTLFSQYRIWEKRKVLYRHALANMSLDNVRLAMARLSDIDVVSKTDSEFNVFILFADLCITLYHGEKTQGLSLSYG